MRSIPLRSYGMLLAALLMGAAAGGMVVSRLSKSAAMKAPEPRATIKEAGVPIIKFKRAEQALALGIETRPCQAIHWRPKLAVDGRVVPNPQAILELRTPFTGVLRVDHECPPWRLGTYVEANKLLALLEPRYSPSERNDLLSKVIEAEERLVSAEKNLRLSDEKLTRLKTLEKTGPGVLLQDDIDAAVMQLARAQTERNSVLRQLQIYQDAAKHTHEKPTPVPLTSSLSGEIVEIGAHPDSNVDAGQMLARIVDFNRVLVRVDFPITPPLKPPDRLVLEPLNAAGNPGWSAIRRGPAAGMEAGSQRTSYLYEIAPVAGAVTASATGKESMGDKPVAESPRWQPGLFVKAVIDDPAAAPIDAVTIPASALLLHQGRTWVYVDLQLDGKSVGRFERREVLVLGRQGDLLVVNSFDTNNGLRDEELVVWASAQILLSEEFRNVADDDDG